MSVRAYIIRKFNVHLTDDEIIFEKVVDRTPLFNVWHDSMIFEVFQDYGCDLSNDDAIGEITLSKSGWRNFKKNFKKEGWEEKDLEILNKINEELEDEEDIWCECF